MVLGFFDTYADAIDEYAEIDLGSVFCIKQYRQRGYTENNGDGAWKIQYWDGSAWVDWVTFPTRSGDNWSTWYTEGKYIQTSKIKLICTTVDSSSQSGIQELDVKW